jgi:hypothetical protein
MATEIDYWRAAAGISRLERIRNERVGEIMRVDRNIVGKGKALPLHAMKALGGIGGIAPTHSRPRH